MAYHLSLLYFLRIRAEVFVLPSSTQVHQLKYRALQEESVSAFDIDAKGAKGVMESR
jgi:hypothetical protein